MDIHPIILGKLDKEMFTKATDLAGDFLDIDMPAEIGSDLSVLAQSVGAQFVNMNAITELKLEDRETGLHLALDYTVAMLVIAYNMGVYHANTNT